MRKKERNRSEEIFEEQTKENQVGGSLPDVANEWRSKKYWQNEDDEDDEEDDEEEYAEDDEEDYEEFDEEDETKDSGKVIIILAIIVAAVIAVAGVLVYKHLTEKNNATALATQTEQMTQTDSQEQAESLSADPRMVETIGSTPETSVSDYDQVEATPETSISDYEYSTIQDTAMISQETNEISLSDSTEATDHDLTVTANNTGAVTVVNTVMIGDVRFREIANIATAESCGWVCSNSADYDWFVNTACVGADEMIGDGTKIFISIGLNDLDKYADYAKTINAKATEWKQRGAEVYFVSVGPVAPECGIANTDICTFNTYMYQNLTDIPFIDAYNYLVQNGFQSVNDQSTSYTEGTTTTLYDYITEFF